MTTAAIGGGGLSRPGRKVLVAVSLLLAAAMLALYSLQAPTPSTPAGGGGFTTDYRSELASFRSSTVALQSEGNQALGDGVDQVLPVYQHLRTATLQAADSFAKLTPPSSAKADYTRFLQLLHQQADTLQVVLTAVRTNQTRQLGASLQHYAALVSDWLTIRQSLETHLR
jgi:hypothetical protein